MSTISIHEVRIPVEGVFISCTLISPKKKARFPHPGLLMIHGWKTNNVPYIDKAREFARRGFTCLAINLRGHGTSDGDWRTSTRAQHLADAMAAYDLLAATPNVDPGNIGVMAASYGCYIAMLLASLRRTAWLALRAPALYPNAGFDRPTEKVIEDLGDYRKRYISPSRNRALKSLTMFKGNVLVVAGEKDEDIPLRSIDSISNACQNAIEVEVDVISDADHTLSHPAWRSLANCLIKDWVIAQA